MVFQIRRRRAKSAGAVDSSPSPTPTPRPVQTIPPVPALPSAMLTGNGQDPTTHSLFRGMLRRVKSGGLHRKESSSESQFDDPLDPPRGGGTTKFAPDRRSKMPVPMPIPSIPPIRLDLSLSSSSQPSLGSSTPPHLDDEFATWLEIVQAAGDSASDSSTCETSCPSTPSYTNTSTSAYSLVSSSSHTSYRGSSAVKLASPPPIRSCAVIKSDLSSPITPGCIHYSGSLSHDDVVSKKNLVAEVDAEDFTIYGLDDVDPSTTVTYAQPHLFTTNPKLTNPKTRIKPKDRSGLGPRGLDLLDYTLLRLSSSFPRSVPIPSRLMRTLHHPLSTNKHRHIQDKGPEMEMRVILGRVGIARKAQGGATAHERLELEGYDSVGAEDEVVPLTAARAIPVSIRQILGPLDDDSTRSTTEEIPMAMAKTRSMRSSSVLTPQQISQWAARPSFMESHDELLFYSEEIILNRPIEPQLKSLPLSLSGRIRMLAKVGRSDAGGGLGGTNSSALFLKVQYQRQYRLPGPIGIGAIQLGAKDRHSSCLSVRPTWMDSDRRASRRAEEEEDETPLALLVSCSSSSQRITNTQLPTPRIAEPPQRPPRRRPITQFAPKSTHPAKPPLPSPRLPEWKRKEEIEQSLAKLNGSPPRRASQVPHPRLSAQTPIGKTAKSSSLHPSRVLVHSYTHPDLRLSTIGPWGPTAYRVVNHGLPLALGPILPQPPSTSSQPNLPHPIYPLKPTPNQTTPFLPIPPIHLSHYISSPNISRLARPHSSQMVSVDSAVKSLASTRPSRPTRAAVRPVVIAVPNSKVTMRDHQGTYREVGSKMVKGDGVVLLRSMAVKRVSEGRW